ncbi:MAG TPA: hypothetical protein VFW64_15090 [Pseudonocardiaceae bacterium]|nr:hypothetical protein [Pseudonocardiaceae bacterium]
MRTLIVTEFITLDGVVEAPGGEPTHPHSGWTMPYGVPELYAYKLQETLEAESLLLGRITYQGFSTAWPQRTGELRLMVYPIMIGGGLTIFPDQRTRSRLSSPTWCATPAASCCRSTAQHPDGFIPESPRAADVSLPHQPAEPASDTRKPGNDRE